MKKSPSSRGFAVLPVVIVVGIILLVGSFFFGGFPSEKPPTDPQERRDWISEKVYDSIYTHDQVNIDYKEPTQAELDALKNKISLERNYPKRINALFEIGANTETILYLGDELKDLGVNTYIVQAEYELKGGKPKIFRPGYNSFAILSQEKAKRVIIHRMLMAKEQGFAVGFIPDYPSYFNFGKDKYDIDKFEPQYIEVALEWAKIAEEMGLEYFVPVNEYEKLLESNDFDLDFIYERTNAFYKKLMPQLREIYSGKIIMKTGHLGDWENHKNLDHTLADLFGVGTFYALDKENIRRDMDDMVSAADDISKRDGTPWLVTEFLIATPEDIERDFAGEGVRIDMKDAYEAGIAAMKRSTQAVGFTFTGYIGTGKIRGTGAIPLLKEYFKKW